MKILEVTSFRCLPCPRLVPTSSFALCFKFLPSRLLYSYIFFDFLQYPTLRYVTCVISLLQQLSTTTFFCLGVHRNIQKGIVSLVFHISLSALIYSEQSHSSFWCRQPQRKLFIPVDYSQRHLQHRSIDSVLQISSIRHLDAFVCLRHFRIHTST